MKKRVSLLLAVIVIAAYSVNVFADDSKKIETALNNTAEYIYSAVISPSVSSIGGEWAVLGLARSGFDVPDEYYEKYYKNVEDYLKKRGGVLHEKKYTEYSRVVLALNAIGKNPENVSGYNLLLPLGDFEKTVWQGLNGPIWALIALDSGDYEMPYNADAEIHATREMYVNRILECQLSDGGWSLTGEGKSDPDITGMALTALSKYKSRSDVSQAIERALLYLSEIQTQTGGFSSMEKENLESCAQVITALCTLGISADDERFVKNGKSAIDGLFLYYKQNGGFTHTLDSQGSDLMAAEQGFCALAALNRYLNGKNSLYDMSDVIKNEALKNSGDSQIENTPVKKMPVIYPERTFADVNSHENRRQIEALASRNIINGKSENSFEPDSTMTRAEFAAIVVKSLGLEVTSEQIFDDVLKTDWFYGFVSTAYKQGIVSGVSENEFNPNGIITKEEAAVMTARAAALCGIDTSYDSNQARDILAGFTDYTKTSEWAGEALAFCYDKRILSDDDIEIKPESVVTRAQIAVMLYNLLDYAELI